MREAAAGDRRHLSLAEVRLEAKRIWGELPPGAVVWLSGDLGAGKTAFVQALSDAAGAAPARSPSFALVHEYPSPAGLLIHVDCYRLRSADEALDLDFPELARRARLLLVEWPEKAGGHVPAPDAHLAFGHIDDPARRRVQRVK